LRALVPSVRLQADATATLTAEGPRDAVALRADLDLGPGGNLAAAATVDVQSTPPRYTAAVRFADVDPGGAIEGLVRARATGRLRVAVSGTRVRLMEALLEGPELKAASAGTLDLDSRTVEASLDATADLSGLGARLGVPLGGAAILRARGAGPLQSLTAEATM